MLWNRSGFSALETMVAVGLSGIVVLGTSSILNVSNKVESQSARHFWLDVRRVEMRNFIHSDDGWAAILAANPNLSCFAAGTSCAAYANPQDMVLPVDNAVLNGASGSTGMSNKGDFCTSFSAVGGNNACPIGISLKWQIVCDDSTCLHGQPKMTVQFQYKDANGVSEDLSSYGFSVYKDAKLETLNEVCAAMGGTLAGITCTLPQLNAACSPATGSFALGFDANGAVICGRPDPGSCASTDAGTGFDSSGGIQCATACP